MDLKRCLQWTARMISRLVGPSTEDAAGEVSLEDLQTMMRWMRALIRDQEEVVELFSSVDKCRLRDLEELAFAADDVLDEYRYYFLRAWIEADQHQPKSTNCKRNHGHWNDEEIDLVPYHMSPVPKELLDKAKEIVQQFDKLTTEWEKFRVWEGDTLIRCDADTIRNLETSSFLHGPVHGREGEKKRIIEILLSPRPFSVYLLPITGMAGIGKTTLAQLVYNDPRLVDAYELKGWVFVGADLDDKKIQSITKNIIESFMDEKCELDRLNELQKKLNKVVRGKTFFLVLDDVWNSTARLWDSLLAPLVDSCSGRIVVTSQDIKVANIGQAHVPCSLENLPFEHCWSLFRKLAFEDPENAPHELQELGKAIVEKCNGLPLAVKALGTSLFRETNPDDWCEVLNSRLWESGERDSAFATMKLSYNRMPLDLKQCFVFLSLFPRGYVFQKDHIIRFWMSLGLLTEETEDAGHRLIEDLLRRSMIQKKLLPKDVDGFFLHDLVHGLAEQVACEDFLTVEDKDFIRMDFNTSYSLRKKRYLSILMYNLENSVGLQPLKESRTLRVMQFVNPRNRWNCCRFDINLPDRLFHDLIHFRALDFSNAVIKRLPDSIGNLKQLRYLALTNTGIEKLPESICHLYNLETLELTKCPLREFPEGIKNLVKLRHLNFQPWYYVCMPCGIRHLTSLITLSRFDVGSGSWHCKISDLKDLVRLRGELCIGGLIDVSCNEEAYAANLQSKEDIRVLRLDWSGTMPGECDHPNDKSGVRAVPCRGQSVHPRLIQEHVLEQLRPHFNLRELHISKYCGFRFPRWLGDVLFTNLVKISLVGDKSSPEFLPALGQLPVLKILSVESMQNVQSVGGEFCSLNEAIKGFQSLEMLEFSDMNKWSEWSGVKDGEFCSLQTLKLVDCRKLRSLPEPLSSSLSKLVLEHCDKLTRIPVLPSLKCLILKGWLDEAIFSNLSLPSLRIFKVCNSSNIRSLYISYQTLPFLEMVVIQECQNLQSVIGFSGLSSLKTFKIKSCGKVRFYQDEEMPQLLQKLEISCCEMLKCWCQLHRRKLEIQLGDNGVIDEELQELEDHSETESDVDEMDWSS